MNPVDLLPGTASSNRVLLLSEIALLVVGPAVTAWGLDHWAFRDWVDAPLLFHAAPTAQPVDMASHGRIPRDRHPRWHIAL